MRPSHAEAAAGGEAEARRDVLVPEYAEHRGGREHRDRSQARRRSCTREIERGRPTEVWSRMMSQSELSSGEPCRWDEPPRVTTDVELDSPRARGRRRRAQGARRWTRVWF